mmetsp:Transcript_4197/g.7745  ORF Transcript_4197/g.7745 Transcript_4197/m.7745 type:complete len:741 (-) Transcript_4197:115-2337(-)
MVSSFTLIFCEVVILFAVTWMLLRYYKSPSVPMDTIISTYYTWIMSFAGTLLLPFDIAISLTGEDYTDTMLEMWNVIYWSTFLLTWVVLPVQMAYRMSGEFGFRGKMWEAVRSNLYFFAAALLVSVIFIVYMLAAHGSSSAVEFVGLMMAMGNTYGVLLIICLLGNGLVALPKRLWHMGQPQKEVERMYLLAHSVETSLHDARFKLEDVELKANTMLEAFDSPSNTQTELTPMVETIRRKLNGFEFALRSTSTKFLKKNVDKRKKEEKGESGGFFSGIFGRSSGNASSVEAAVILEKKDLISLHAKLINAQMRASSAERRWRSLVLNIRGEESLLDGTMRAQDCCWLGVKEYGSDPASIAHIEEMNDERDQGICQVACCVLPIPASLARSYYGTMDTIRLFWRRRLYHHACRLLAILCALASGLILYSELAMSTNMRSPIGFLLVNLSDEGAGLFMVQSVSFVYLFYMSFCTFYSFFKMNFGWSFTLQGNQQSPATSLIFNGTYLSRLQFSLGYNYLLFLNVKRIDNTSFQHLMSNMDIVPLFGNSFVIYAPIITVILGLCTFFNVYGRFLKCLGIESEDSIVAHDCFQEMTDADRAEIATGKKLVASALRDSKFAVASAGRISPVKDTVSLLSGAGGLSSDHSDSSNNSSDSGGDVEMGSFGFGSSSATSKSSSSKSKSNGLNGDDGWGSSSYSSSQTDPAPSSSSRNGGGAGSSGGGGSDGWGSSTASTGRVYGGRYG